MFSGIIEEIGTITTITPRGDSCKLHISAATVTTDIHPGDSIAVNGICLTVVDHGPTGFTADVMKETLDRSVLGHVGDPVNLERALPVTGRLGGHIVQGHVDTTTTLIHREIGELFFQGGSIAFCEGLKYVLKNIQEAGVSVMVGDYEIGRASCRERV